MNNNTLVLPATLRGRCAALSHAYEGTSVPAAGLSAIAMPFAASSTTTPIVQAPLAVTRDGKVGLRSRKRPPC